MAGMVFLVPWEVSTLNLMCNCQNSLQLNYQKLTIEVLAFGILVSPVNYSGVVRRPLGMQAHPRSKTLCP